MKKSLIILLGLSLLASGFLTSCLKGEEETYYTVYVAPAVSNEHFEGSTKKCITEVLDQIKSYNGYINNYTEENDKISIVPPYYAYSGVPASDTLNAMQELLSSLYKTLQVASADVARVDWDRSLKDEFGETDFWFSTVSFDYLFTEIVGASPVSLLIHVSNPKLQSNCTYVNNDTSLALNSFSFGSTRYSKGYVKASCKIGGSTLELKAIDKAEFVYIESEDGKYHFELTYDSPDKTDELTLISQTIDGVKKDFPTPVVYKTVDL